MGRIGLNSVNYLQYLKRNSKYIEFNIARHIYPFLSNKQLEPEDYDLSVADRWPKMLNPSEWNIVKSKKKNILHGVLPS